MTYTFIPAKPATDRQISYLDALIKMRAIPQNLIDLYEANKRDNLLTKETASRFISTFLKAPLLSTARTAANFAERDEKMKQLMELVETFPEAKYAIPAEELMVDLLKKPIKNDLVFCELKKYRGRLYFKQLHGSPGWFSRSLFPVEDAIVFARIIQKDPYKYTRIFADHYRCCGRCGAELTDELSRETRLGPTCRKYFGK